MAEGLTEFVVVGASQTVPCGQAGIARRSMHAKPLAVRVIHKARLENGCRRCLRGVDSRGR